MSKPFNLEEAKAGKPVQTRDGRKVRILCTDAAGPLPVIAAIRCQAIDLPTRRRADGLLFDGEESKNDLVMATVIHTKWINVFPADIARGELRNRRMYDTKEGAQTFATCEGVITVPITWEE